MPLMSVPTTIDSLRRDDDARTSGRASGLGDVRRKQSATSVTSTKILGSTTMKDAGVRMTSVPWTSTLWTRTSIPWITEWITLWRVLENVERMASVQCSRRRPSCVESVRNASSSCCGPTRRPPTAFILGGCHESGVGESSDHGTRSLRAYIPAKKRDHWSSRHGDDQG